MGELIDKMNGAQVFCLLVVLLIVSGSVIGVVAKSIAARKIGHWPIDVKRHKYKDEFR